MRMKFCFLLMTWVPLASFAAAPAAADSVHHRPITLDEAILLARVQSVDAAVALNELKTAYWEYRTFRADLLPEVNLTATLPSYNKSYNSYQQDDGSYTFVRNNYMQMSGQLSIDQNIWLTGGTLSLNTSLDFLRQMDGTVGNRFMSVPLAESAHLRREHHQVGPPYRARALRRGQGSLPQCHRGSDDDHHQSFLQPSAGPRERQHRPSEPGQRREASRGCEGQAPHVTSNESSLKSNMFALRSFLALGEDEELEPVVPDSVPDVLLNYDEVLDKALKNNSFAHNIRRRQLEADYEVAKAKGNMREITLFAQVGFTGTDNRFDSAYRRLKDNQVVEVGFKIPILDWGKRRGQVKVAQSNREVTESKLRQESMNFNQNIFILVEQFNNQQAQLHLADEADRIARKRYHTNVETFLIGKISTLDLNDSQTQKDEARRKHITELFYYWYYYYQLRSLTLWDFVAGTGIDADFDKIVRR